MPEAPFESDFSEGIYKQRYIHPDDGNWSGTSRRVAAAPLDALATHTGKPLDTYKNDIYELFNARKAIAGGRYLYASGRDFHQVNNCVLLRCEDTRESWATTSYQSEMALMTGAGIGVYYGDVRPSGSIISRTGGEASGPLAKMQQINETGRHIMQGGQRRSAIWAGLPWWHADIFDFLAVKDWSDDIRAMKAKDWNFAAPLDMTNISVCLDDEFFELYKYGTLENQAWFMDKGYSAPDDGTWSMWAHRVYDTAIAHMLKHGEPGFSVDRGDKSDEVLRNACTEITSADDSDVCNLGSLVLPRFSTPKEFGKAVRDMTLFLTAGSVYSDVPYERVAEVREKNRRLGLGLIGVHEFCMKNGTRYGTPESFEVLEPYMEEYGRALEYAHEHQNYLGLSLSKGATAIAPNGTIGIVAESTPSGDPLFSAAELRNVKFAGPKGDAYKQYVVIDPVAARLVKEGVDPAIIEDAGSLSMFPERRLAMQAFLQKYTDHAISSTCNLDRVYDAPQDVEFFKSEFMEYLPDLRGMTVYPDGARAGQPRNPVNLEWAMENADAVFEGNEETCLTGACGV